MKITLGWIPQQEVEDVDAEAAVAVEAEVEAVDVDTRKMSQSLRSTRGRNPWGTLKEHMRKDGRRGKPVKTYHPHHHHQTLLRSS